MRTKTALSPGDNPQGLGGCGKHRSMVPLCRWGDQSCTAQCPRLRVALTALGQCCSLAQHHAFADCQTCTPLTASRATSGTLRKAMQSNWSRLVAPHTRRSGLRVGYERLAFRQLCEVQGALSRRRSLGDEPRITGFPSSNEDRVRRDPAIGPRGLFCFGAAQLWPQPEAERAGYPIKAGIKHGVMVGGLHVTHH